MNTYTIRLLQNLLILLLPILIVIGSIRLLITDEYLAFEYSKAGFPADPFGFAPSQRLDYASVNFRYVRENQPIDALSGLRVDEQSVYNERELEHMQDVQKVYQKAILIWHFVLGLSVLVGLALAWQVETRHALFTALQWGGLLTVGLIAAIGILAVIAWQVWFVAFHQVFFAAGTWTFNTSDTLIRLFPEKFWFDAVLTISGVSLAVGLILALLGMNCKNRLGSSRSNMDVVNQKKHSNGYREVHDE